jgi:hypothetical protein
MFIKIRTDFKSLLKFFVYLCIAEDAHFLFLLNLSSGEYRKIRQLLFIIGILFLLFLRTKKSKYEDLARRYLFVRVYNIYLIIVFCAVAIFSMLTYHESLWNVFSEGFSYFYLFLVPIVICFFQENDIDPDRFFHFLAVIGMVDAFIIVFSAISVDVGIPPLFQGIIYHFKDGHTRITYQMISLYSLVYYFDRFIKTVATKQRKKGILYFFMLFIAFGGMVYYDNTRITLIAMVVAFAIMIITYSGDNNTKIIFMGVLLIIIVLMLCTNSINSLFDSFSLDSDKGTSTLARMNAIEHYRSFFVEKPFWGMGVVSPINEELSLIVYGPTGTSAFVDLGILGGVYRFGLIGVFIFIAPLIRLVYVLVELIRQKSHYSSLIVGAVVYLLISQISLNFLDSPRAVFSAVFGGMIEYIYYLEKKKQ